MRNFGGESPQNNTTVNLAMATSHLQLGYFARAEALYKQALNIQRHQYGENSRKLANVYVNLGDVAMRRGHLTEAETYYKKAVAIYDNMLVVENADKSNFALAQFHLGTFLLNAHRFAEAEPLLRRAYETYQSLYQRKSAITVLERLCATVLEQGKLGEAMKLLSQAESAARKSTPPHPALGSIHRTFAKVYERLRDPETSKTHYEKALEAYRELSPEEGGLDAENFLRIANIEVEIGNHRDAEASFLKAMELAKPAGDKLLCADALNGLGLLFKRLGRFDEAETHYKSALKIREVALSPTDPSLAVVLANLSVLYEERGRCEETLETLRRAVGILERAKLEDPASLARLASNLERMGNLYNRLDDPAASVSCYEKAVTLYERDAQRHEASIARVLTNLGYAHNRLNNCSKAVVPLERAYELRNNRCASETDESTDDILLGLGWDYLRLRQFEKAKTLYLRMIDRARKKNSPHLAAILDGLGSACRYLEQYPEALEFLREALSVREREPEPERHALAKCYWRLGFVSLKLEEFEEAERCYREALGFYEAMADHEEVVERVLPKLRAEWDELQQARQTME